MSIVDLYITKYKEYVRNTPGLRSYSTNWILNLLTLLAGACKEVSLHPDYETLDEKTANGEYQCLLQLIPYQEDAPVGVILGVGPTYQRSQISAVHKAFEYLEILIKTVDKRIKVTEDGKII